MLLPPRAELSLACGERLAVHAFSIREQISSLFALRILARSPDPCIDLRALVGQPAALRIASATQHALHERRWAGVCNQARLVRAVALDAGEAALSTYELSIAPRLWLLSQRFNHRVFQHRSAPEIARVLLEEHAIPAAWHVHTAEYPRLSYKVQYGESDFAFLSRLLEEAGISYSIIDDEELGALLVLSDAPEKIAPSREDPIVFLDDPSAAREREYVTAVSVTEESRIEAVSLRDHDFLRPAWLLLGEARRGGAEAGALERFSYRPGAFVIERDGGGSAHDAAYGAALATRALEAERTGRRWRRSCSRWTGSRAG